MKATMAEITINHRYGHVFLHIRGKTALGWMTRVSRLSPEMADKIADGLRDCAARARKEKPARKLRIAR